MFYRGFARCLGSSTRKVCQYVFFVCSQQRAFRLVLRADAQHQATAGQRRKGHEASPWVLVVVFVFAAAAAAADAGAAAVVVVVVVVVGGGGGRLLVDVLVVC